MKITKEQYEKLDTIIRNSFGYVQCPICNKFSMEVNEPYYEKMEIFKTECPVCGHITCFNPQILLNLKNRQDLEI